MNFNRGLRSIELQLPLNPNGGLRPTNEDQSLRLGKQVPFAEGTEPTGNRPLGIHQFFGTVSPRSPVNWLALRATG